MTIKELEKEIENVEKEIENVEKERKELFSKEQQLRMQKTKLEREERNAGFRNFMINLAGRCFGVCMVHVICENLKKENEIKEYCISDYMDE